MFLTPLLDRILDRVREPDSSANPVTISRAYSDIYHFYVRMPNLSCRRRWPGDRGSAWRYRWGRVRVHRGAVVCAVRAGSGPVARGRISRAVPCVPCPREDRSAADGGVLVGWRVRLLVWWQFPRGPRRRGARRPGRAAGIVGVLFLDQDSQGVHPRCPPRTSGPCPR